MEIVRTSHHYILITLLRGMKFEEPPENKKSQRIRIPPTGERVPISEHRNETCNYREE
jgi:hypothetical protein